jgi:hypothetical protein
MQLYLSNDGYNKSGAGDRAVFESKYRYY